MEYIRPSREERRAVIINDPRPVDNVGGIWASMGRAANVGIFLLLFGAFLYFGRAIALPILSAADLVVFNHLFPHDDVKLPD